MELLRIKQGQNMYHNFTVDDREVGKLVLDVMNETNFNGVTVSYGTLCNLNVPVCREVYSGVLVFVGSD